MLGTARVTGFGSSNLGVAWGRRLGVVVHKTGGNIATFRLNVTTFLRVYVPML